jgi:phosphomannomutase
MLAIFALAADQKCPVSQLMAALPARYTHSDRIQNFATEKSRALIAALAAGEISTETVMAPDSGEAVSKDLTDGYRVTFSSGDIVHLRPSGNAPELRCYAESESVARAKQLCDACLKAVQRA